MEIQELENRLITLFRKAASASLPDFIFTILRVEGITCQKEWDEFIESESIKKRISERKAKYLTIIGDKYTDLLDTLATYVEICSTLPPYHMLTNIIRVANGNQYTYTPFGLKYINSPFANAQNKEAMPNKTEIIRSIVSDSEDLKWIIEQISFIDEELICSIENNRWQITESGEIEILLNGNRRIGIKQLTNNLSEAKKLYETLINLLQRARLEFIKMGDKSFVFGDYSEEFQFLTNDEVGLYGFKIKRPSGTDSQFTRTDKGTTAINMSLDKNGQIEFFIGDWGEFKSHPTLHAIKNPAALKYSPEGEWKPIIYPADTDKIQQEILKESTDERVWGCLFYIRCTGYKIIEFVAKAKIKLTDKEIQFDNGINLYLCDTKQEVIGQNVFVYDGWVQLKDGRVETIKHAIDDIAFTMNMLSLIFESPVVWVLKYSLCDHSRGFANPSDKDIELLKDIIKTHATRPLLSAIDWYTRGQTASDVYTRFLCFWIALEGLAQTVYEDKDSNVWTIIRDSKEKRQTDASSWLKKYNNSFEQVDLLKFFQEGYFEFTVPIRKRTEAVLEGIFGKDSPIVKDIFQKKVDNLTIWELRGKLAHGLLSNWDFVNEEIVSKRLHIVSEISRAFIIRVALKLSPSQNIPKWSRLFGLAMSGFDPRSCLVASHEKILPTGEWKIKPEWIGA